MPTSHLFTNALKQAGYRLTPQRRAICDYLAATDQHPTPYQVYTELSAQHPEISRATVYNTLKVLERLGAIVEIAIGGDHTHYETNTTPHVNLICLRCHKIFDVDAPPAFSAVQTAVQESSGFQPVALRIDALGFCTECRDRKKAEIVAHWEAQQAETGSVTEPAADNEQTPHDF